MSLPLYHPRVYHAIIHIEEKEPSERNTYFVVRYTPNSKQRKRKTLRELKEKLPDVVRLTKQQTLSLLMILLPVFPSHCLTF